MATFLNTLFGVILGGSLTLLGTLWSHKLQVNAKKDDDRRLVDSFVQGIYDEISTLWDRYSEGPGLLLEKLEEGKGFESYYSVNHDYFTFYTANASLLGRVHDSNLRKQIVTFYINAKGLLDTYFLNNEMLRKLEHALIENEQSPSTFNKNKFNIRMTELINYAEVLKKEHNAMKILTKKLLGVIQSFSDLEKK